MHTGIAGEQGQNIDNSVTINHLTLKFLSDFRQLRNSLFRESNVIRVLYVSIKKLCVSEVLKIHRYTFVQSIGILKEVALHLILGLSINNNGNRSTSSLPIDFT